MINKKEVEYRRLNKLLKGLGIKKIRVSDLYEVKQVVEVY